MTDTNVDLFTYCSLKLTLSYSFHLLLCVCVVTLVYHAMYPHLLLKSAVSDNKNELIQVVVTGNVTTHKMVHIMEPYSANTFKRDLGAPYL